MRGAGAKTKQCTGEEQAERKKKARNKNAAKKRVRVKRTPKFLQVYLSWCISERQTIQSGLYIKFFSKKPTKTTVTQKTILIISRSRFNIK